MSNAKAQSRRGAKLRIGMRVEIYWNHFCKRRHRRVQEWIPGKLLTIRPGGRLDVKSDSGMHGVDCDPICVRKPKTEAKP